jgi:hypothetical protein
MSGIGQTSDGTKVLKSALVTGLHPGGSMAHPNEAAFDPETVTLLAAVLDRVWKALPQGQTSATRAQIAERILSHAVQGERSAARLYDVVLAHFAAPAT